jgi:hypothetical protein
MKRAFASLAIAVGLGAICLSPAVPPISTAAAGSPHRPSTGGQQPPGNVTVGVPEAAISAVDVLPATLFVGTSYAGVVHIALAGGQDDARAEVAVQGATRKVGVERRLVAGKVATVSFALVPALHAGQVSVTVTVRLSRGQVLTKIFHHQVSQ